MATRALHSALDELTVGDAMHAGLLTCPEEATLEAVSPTGPYGPMAEMTATPVG